MDHFVDFMRSAVGRTVRIVLGLVLIGLGLFGDAGFFVGIIGLVPLVAGWVNFCLFAPLFGRTIWGKPRVAH